MASIACKCASRGVVLRGAPRSSRVTSRQSPASFRRSSQLLPSRVNRPQATDEEKSSPAAAGDDEDLPPWIRREREKAAAESTGELPFGVYLLFSSMVAIAAIGSIFEFANKNAIFGVVEPDSPLYGPILLTFGLTGLPTAGYLFVKAVTAANKAADAMDNVDGY